jgi:hypothetical protein
LSQALGADRVASAKFDDGELFHGDAEGWSEIQDLGQGFASLFQLALLGLAPGLEKKKPRVTRIFGEPF